jgi:hypothetical protein
MAAESASFKIGRGGIFYMFAGLAVAGIAGGVAMAAGGEWGLGAALLIGGGFSAMLCIWMPGVLRLDESGLEIQRRRGTQRLQWSEVDRATWTSARGSAVERAVDRWVLTLDGRSNGKRTTVVLSGPMLERQREVRELLAARFPPRR